MKKKKYKIKFMKLIEGYSERKEIHVNNFIFVFENIYERKGGVVVLSVA